MYQRASSDRYQILSEGPNKITCQPGFGLRGLSFTHVHYSAGVVSTPFLSSVLTVLCLCPVWMEQTYVHAVIVDPEVVFVANQSCAQAPSLVASFQCDCHLKSDGSLLSASANIRDLQLLACPFIHKQEDKAVSTVRPDKHYI